MKDEGSLEVRSLKPIQSKIRIPSHYVKGMSNNFFLIDSIDFIYDFSGEWGETLDFVVETV
jgi:hypothetical protein